MSVCTFCLYIKSETVQQSNSCECHHNNSLSIAGEHSRSLTLCMVRAPALSRRARRLSVRHFALLAKFAQLFDRLLIVFVCFFLFLFCIYFCRRVSVSFVILFFACFACFCLVSADLCRVVFESKRSMFNCINRYIIFFWAFAKIYCRLVVLRIIGCYVYIYEMYIRRDV